MLIATWNVNSIRTRLSQILDWINQSNPDILCLQETKVMDDSFPVEPFEKLGYSVEVYGQKSYNGVAIISKTKPVAWPPKSKNLFLNFFAFSRPFLTPGFFSRASFAS